MADRTSSVVAQQSAQSVQQQQQQQLTAAATRLVFLGKELPDRETLAHCGACPKTDSYTRVRATHMTAEVGTVHFWGAVEVLLSPAVISPPLHREQVSRPRTRFTWCLRPAGETSRGLWLRTS